MTRPTTKWQRINRRFGHDGNPLRRRSDVLEAWLVPIAILVFMALCPLILSLTGSWMRAANANEARAQRDWHHVQATLVQSVPGPEQADHGVNTWLVWTPATWTYPAGVQHKGDVPAIGGSRQGSVVTAWLDRSGKVHMPPLTLGEKGSRVLEARAAGLAVLAALLAIMVTVVRRVLNRRRLAGWESDWLAVGPTWSRHR